MGKSKKRTKNLIEVKQALADKYKRLAVLSGSRGRKVRLFRKAERFVRQAQQAQRV